MNPFLSIDDFASQFGRDLSDAETIVATRLLQVASDWIRGRKPDVDPLAAAQVVFEVNRDAINFGAYERLASFSNVTQSRTEAGSFGRDDQWQQVVVDYITNKQKRLLGIPVVAAAAYSFPVGEFDRPCATWPSGWW